jgi:L-fuconate dehydratase
VRIVNGRYAAPTAPGYSITMKPQSLADYEFPSGREWRGAVAPSSVASATASNRT